MNFDKEAMFYEKLEDKKVQCNLCPHHCLIYENKSGICRVRKNKDGVLYATNYGETISFSIDPIEKKPLYHYHPSAKILSVGPNSCNFKCQFCQNYNISQYEVPTHSITPEDILDKCKQSNVKQVAFTYTEPFTWFEFIYDTVKKLKDNDIGIVMVTNGYVEEKPLKELLPYIDAFNVDLKAMNDEFYKKVCNGSLNPILRNIKLIAASAHLEVTNLIITNNNDEKEELRKLVDFIAEINPDIPIHFSRYYPAFKMNEPPTPVSTLKQAYFIAKEKLSYVYLGNVITEKNSNTYCKECDKLLVERVGFGTKIKGIKNKRCVNCDEKIYGEWD